MIVRTAGLVLVVLGIVAVIFGAAMYFEWMRWFGRLPGDIQIGRPGLEIFVPITSILVVSAVSAALVQLLRRIL